MSTNIDLKYVKKNHVNNKLKNKYNFKNFLEEKNSTIIVDLPESYLKEFQYKLKKKTTEKLFASITKL